MKLELRALSIHKVISFPVPSGRNRFSDNVQLIDVNNNTIHLWKDKILLRPVKRPRNQIDFHSHSLGNRRKEMKACRPNEPIKKETEMKLLTSDVTCFL